MTDASVDVYVLGTGMVGYRQLTQECEQALERAVEVYLLNPLPEVHEFVADLCTSVVDLSEEYEIGRDRTESYEEMARRVVDGANAANGPVALALYGHPTLGVTPSRRVQAWGEEEGLTVEVIPGVSSLDCLFTDFGIDPLERGMQLHEATDVLVYDIALNTLVPALIMQIGLVGTRLYGGHSSTPERFTAFRRHLERFYPQDHRVHFLRTATFPLADPERITVRVDEFESVAEEIDITHTLLVPPAQDRTVENEDLAERVRSETYLDSVTE